MNNLREMLGKCEAGGWTDDETRRVPAAHPALVHRVLDQKTLEICDPQRAELLRRIKGDFPTLTLL